MTLQTAIVRASLLPLLCASIVVRAAIVDVERAPAGGIQPQAEVDARGNVHLIFYKGDAGGGDVFYVRRPAAGGAFSSPVRVNTQPGSAIAAGSIRGAQLALGKNGRVHVVWNGGKGAKKVMIGGKEHTPLLYTRLGDDGKTFEPERNLLTKLTYLDGGSSVAADPFGNVYVTINGSPIDNKRGELGRGLYLARSADDGKTFAAEELAAPTPMGACACCGMRAFADARGAVYVTYRCAKTALERDEIFLLSPKPGAPFQIVSAQPWRTSACPMSSTTLTPAPNGALASWQTEDRVYFATIDRSTLQLSRPISPPAGPKRRHSVAVANARGETILVWTEGTAWAKGGSVHWQTFDAAGTPLGDQGRAGALPVWGLPTAYARPDGGFTILY